MQYVAHWAFKIVCSNIIIGLSFTWIKATPPSSPPPSPPPQDSWIHILHSTLCCVILESLAFISTVSVLKELSEFCVPSALFHVGICRCNEMHYACTSVCTHRCLSDCGGISQDDEMFPPHSQPFKTDSLVRSSKDWGSINRTALSFSWLRTPKGQADRDGCWG